MDDLPFPYAPLCHPSRIVVGRMLPLDESQVEALSFREIRVSEAFTIQGPCGKYFRASLKSLRGQGGEALAYEEMPHSPESPLGLTLLCAVLARQRMIQVVQKATELGVTRIVPVLTECSVKAEGLEHEKAHAWPAQVLRAARQCRRASVPLLAPAVPLAEALAAAPWRGSACRLALDDRAGETVPLARGPASAALAVGPEGGWTDPERELLRDAGALPLVLGGRVLRAETAVVSGLALVQHWLGDLVSG